MEKAHLSCCPDASDNARLVAVTFVHRFGSALNSDIHLHCCVVDGVFGAADESLRFDQALLTPQAIAKVQTEVRERVLRLFKRRALPSSPRRIRFNESYSISVNRPHRHELSQLERPTGLAGARF